uniref:DNA polymerase epsilon subunit 3 n=1 Tax=Lepeophtheirus salmonis TaxID=72036 RepID=C1BSH3_LEPSM|nr:DNA polymerase epsilon subunit 3 [Lepeophtheirus salmonis]
MAEKPEDLNLPTSVVTKIIKESLPSHVKVSKEANVAIAKAASVFVLYATSCSNNAAMKTNRKTIHGNDVISAMGDMEFDKFARPLENSLENWKKSQQKKKDTAAAKKRLIANEKVIAIHLPLKIPLRLKKMTKKIRKTRMRRTNNFPFHSRMNF